MRKMENIKQSKVNVQLIRRGIAYSGMLHLMIHHMIFSDPSNNLELWICYPMLQQVERRPPSVGGFSALRVRCRDFTFLTFNFRRDDECASTFESIKSLTCVSAADKLYAFAYKPGTVERAFNSWDIYDPEKEFARQGLGTTFPQWRMTNLNYDYTLSPTYPGILAIPASISDNVLNYGAKYRSKARVPALTYIHALNGCTITRASQPMVGLKQNRSLQDEKLVLSIFDSTAPQPGVYGATASGHLIVDARPTANAMANVALGAGSENMDHYPAAKKVYLGIENIHVMRESLNKVIDAIKDADLTPLPPNKELLQKSNWLKHISNVLDGAAIVARTIHIGGSHVLVHCSDGWDRTSQLCSLAELCLDPYYRTLDGFIVLIEKDWLSFGHRFQERCGHLVSEKSFVNNASSPSSSTSSSTLLASLSGSTSTLRDETGQEGETASAPAPTTATNRAQHALHNLSSKFREVKFNVGSGNNSNTSGGGSNHHGSSLKETAPIFHQFLDCVWQLVCQHPASFEFNERFLRRLLYHCYSCQYGTFLHNCERERREIKQRTHSVWDYFLARRPEFVNPAFRSTSGLIEVETKEVRFWAALFHRPDAEMNGPATRPAAGAGAPTPILGVQVGRAAADQSVDAASPGEEETKVSSTTTS